MGGDPEQEPWTGSGPGPATWGRRGAQEGKAALGGRGWEPGLRFHGIPLSDSRVVKPRDQCAHSPRCRSAGSGWRPQSPHRTPGSHKPDPSSVWASQGCEPSVSGLWEHERTGQGGRTGASSRHTHTPSRGVAWIGAAPGACWPGKVGAVFATSLHWLLASEGRAAPDLGPQRPPPCP